jgi:DNA translocase FtsK/SpoIIIE-like protein
MCMDAGNGLELARSWAERARVAIVVAAARLGSVLEAPGFEGGPAGEAWYEMLSALPLRGGLAEVLTALDEAPGGPDARQPAALVVARVFPDIRRPDAPDAHTAVSYSQAGMPRTVSAISSFVELLEGELGHLDAVMVSGAADLPSGALAACRARYVTGTDMLAAPLRRASGAVSEVAARVTRTEHQLRESMGQSAAEPGGVGLSELLDGADYMAQGGQPTSVATVLGVGSARDVAAVRRRALSLSALEIPVGVDQSCTPVGVSLSSYHRTPHVLVVGEAGAGKSVLLRGMALAAAATRPPHRLALVLVDTAGAGTFTELAGLPHVLTLVDGLGEDVRRDRLESALLGEVSRRLRLLATNGVTTADQYRALDFPAPTGDREPLPSLLIVVDTVDALDRNRARAMRTLLAELAAFHDRLDVHLLISATDYRCDDWQAVAGYRIGLRGADSTVAGTDATAQLPDGGGHGYLSHRGDTPVRFLPARGDQPPAETDRQLTTLLADQPDDRPQRRWPAGLPEQRPTLSGLLSAHPVRPPATDGLAAVPVGLVEKPFDHQVMPHRLDLAGHHALVVGDAGTDGTLSTLLHALASTHDPRHLRLLIIDTDPPRLDRLAPLPHVDAYATPGQPGSLNAALAMVTAHLESWPHATGEPLAHRVVAVGSTADLEHLDTPTLNVLRRLGGEAPATTGMHIVAAARRASDVPYWLKTPATHCYQLHLDNPRDSHYPQRQAWRTPDHPGAALVPPGLPAILAAPLLTPDPPNPHGR